MAMMGPVFSYLYTLVNIGKIKNLLAINNWVDLEIIRHKHGPWVTYY